MNDPNSIMPDDTKTITKVGYGIMFLVAVVVAAIVVAGLVFAFTSISALNTANVFVKVLVIALVVILAIAVVIAIISLIIAPHYVMKGPQYQDRMSYDLDQVESVKETSSEEKKAH